MQGSDHALFFYVSRGLLLVLSLAVAVSTKHQVQPVVHPSQCFSVYADFASFNSFTDLEFYGVL